MSFSPHTSHPPHSHTWPMAMAVPRFLTVLGTSCAPRLPLNGAHTLPSTILPVAVHYPLTVLNAPHQQAPLQPLIIYTWFVHTHTPPPVALTHGSTSPPHGLIVLSLSRPAPRPAAWLYRPFSPHGSDPPTPLSRPLPLTTSSLPPNTHTWSMAVAVHGLLTPHRPRHLLQSSGSPPHSRYRSCYHHHTALIDPCPPHLYNLLPTPHGGSCPRLPSNVPMHGSPQQCRCAGVWKHPHVSSWASVVRLHPLAGTCPPPLALKGICSPPPSSSAALAPHLPGIHWEYTM